MLLDKRLIFVTGKGGVGRSTVAIVLGLLAARRGRRTIVAELAGQDRVQRAFEHQGEHFLEVELAPGLFTISVDPEHAMQEYLRVKTGPLGQALGSSRVFQGFAMATPGMRELLSMGKVWELAQLHRRTRDALPYDLVIVDAPATGHGVGLLRTPKTFADVARVGPIAHQSATIAASLADRAFTGVVAVSTPEEMPVNETLQLSQALGADGLALDLVVLNQLYPSRFTTPEIRRLRRAIAEADRLIAGTMQAAMSEHARAAVQREQRDRLAEQIDAPLAALPFVFAEHLGLDELERLADALEPGIT